MTAAKVMFSKTGMRHGVAVRKLHLQREEKQKLRLQQITSSSYLHNQVLWLVPFTIFCHSNTRRS